MRFSALQDWLTWQESLSPKAIDMGLERVRLVAGRLDLLKPACPVLTVGGTNGKGSVVAMLSAILAAAGYKTGAYTSPHLLQYNERICVAGLPVSDDRLCAAFSAVDDARGDCRLTYFEFGTLAALWCFREEKVEAMLLEVGLGGRLDAVNIIDADVAVITTIDLDHTEWLGNTRDLVAREKVGIQRAGKPLICGDACPPEALIKAAAEAGSELMCIGRDFLVEPHGNEFELTHQGRVDRWPMPGLQGAFQASNAACACMALGCLEDRLPLTDANYRQGLTEVRLAARFESLEGFSCSVVCDVAHNRQAAGGLAKQLSEFPVSGRTIAVFSSLSDKDISGIAGEVDAMVDHWFISGLVAPRGLQAAEVRARMGAVQGSVELHGTVEEAFSHAERMALPEDRIVVFGSFLTVAAVRHARV